jgi:hypothetical protein
MTFIFSLSLSFPFVLPLCSSLYPSSLFRSVTTNDFLRTVKHKIKTCWSWGSQRSLRGETVFWDLFLARTYFLTMKLEAVNSSETSVDFTGLHSLTSYKMILLIRYKLVFCSRCTRTFHLPMATRRYVIVQHAAVDRQTDRRGPEREVSVEPRPSGSWRAAMA